MLDKILLPVKLFNTRSRYVVCLATFVFIGVTPVIADEESETDTGYSTSSGMPFEAVWEQRII